MLILWSVVLVAGLLGLAFAIYKAPYSEWERKVSAAREQNKKVNAGLVWANHIGSEVPQTHLELKSALGLVLAKLSEKARNISFLLREQVQAGSLQGETKEQVDYILRRQREAQRSVDVSIDQWNTLVGALETLGVKFQTQEWGSFVMPKDGILLAALPEQMSAVGFNEKSG